jgi:hypothetical protein
MNNPDHAYTLKWQQLTRDGLMDVTEFDELKTIRKYPTLNSISVFLGALRHYKIQCLYHGITSKSHSRAPAKLPMMSFSLHPKRIIGLLRKLQCIIFYSPD